MKSATKETKKLAYIDEDILFLILKLIDYPYGEQKSFDFEEIQFFNFKKPALLYVFQTISQINSAYGIQLKQFEFDRYGLFYADKKGIKEHLYQMCHPDPLQKYTSVKRIIENKFTLTDLEEVFQKQEKISAVLFSGVNFKITMTEKARNGLHSFIKSYAKAFSEDNLQKVNIAYLNFSDHEAIFEKRARTDYEKYGEGLVLKDFEFGEDFRLLDCMLALEENSDVKINSLGSEKNARDESRFFVSIDLQKKFLKKIGMKAVKRKVAPTCFIKEKIGFLQIAGEVAIKIGGKDTQKFKLLECLVKNFGDGRNIDAVYVDIRKEPLNISTVNFGKQLNHTERFNFVKNTRGELQRDKKLKDFQFKIDKKQNIIFMTFR
ncbi:MAG: hypothetical protein PHH40_01085 [Candidatus Moranbacteria bacterium]|nr:hypothetical protein [Candidatus Moranbacteria bacterium]MDD3964906.1 hypothetical protein [Candidatus Moranbacteria bacterium]